jgi:hypothetical protein
VILRECGRSERGRFARGDLLRVSLGDHIGTTGGGPAKALSLVDCRAVRRGITSAPEGGSGITGGVVDGWHAAVAAGPLQVLQIRPGERDLLAQAGFTRCEGYARSGCDVTRGRPGRWASSAPRATEHRPLWTKYSAWDWPAQRRWSSALRHSRYGATTRRLPGQTRYEAIGWVE